MNNRGKGLKVGVVGCGNMGRNHLRVLSTIGDGAVLWGCFDIDKDLALEQANLYGIKAYDRFEDLFEDVDVAHIVTPSFLHKEYAVDAANSGCHVLVEKPIALSVDDAQKIIDACDKNGVRLCVGHVERFNPSISALRSILASEEVVAVEFHRLSPFYGRVSDASVVEDLMIHDIDVLNAIAHGHSPEHVYAQGTKLYSDKLDFCQALVSFEGGPLASLTASRITESKVRTATVTTKKCYIEVDYIDRTVEVFRKTNFNLDVGYPVQYTQENVVEKVLVPIHEPLRAEFEHFYNCIETGEPVATSGEMGKKALELCELIQSSAMNNLA